MLPAGLFKTVVAKKQEENNSDGGEWFAECSACEAFYETTM